MAVFKRRNKDGEEGETWYVDYRDPTGKRVIKAVGPLKKEAEAFLGKVKGAIREGKFFDIKKPSVITFDQLLDAWIEKVRDRKSFQRSTHYLMPVLREFFGNKFLSEFNYKLIEDFRDHRKQTQTMFGRDRKEMSVDDDLKVLKSILNKGVKWSMLEKNPFDKADDLFYNPQSGRTRALTVDEVRKLIEATRPDRRPILIVAIYTGLRKEDLLTLKWQSVDLERGLIMVVERKSGKVRTIVLNKDVWSLLQGLPVRSEYVFPNKDGKPFQDIDRSFHTALKKAGIDRGEGTNKVVWHTLRHTCISLLTEKGADTSMVKSYVAHASEAMTRHYTHLSEEYSRRTADLLNGLCGNNLETISKNDSISA